MHASPIILDLFLLLGLSIITVLAFKKLDLPAIAGYLIVGVAAGPHALGWVRRTEEVETLAEIGVMLLLFSIGLEFSLPRLLLRGKRMLLAGAGQVSLTLAVVAFGGLAFGLDGRTAVFCGMLAALSSTGFVLKQLHDTRRIDSPHGQLTVEMLLFQDLAVIPLILFVPLLGPEGATGMGDVLAVLGKALAAIVGIVLFARFGFPRLATRVVRVGGRELFVLFIAMVALGTAWFSAALGLSIALGAFLAGLFISESEYSHQVVSEILPFRDVFNALFFISIGMLLDPVTLIDQPLLVGGLVLVVLVAKGVTVFLVGTFVTRSVVVSGFAAVALAQIGEFSFLLERCGERVGLLGGDQTQLFLAVAVSTMFLSPFLYRFVLAWADRRRDSPRVDVPTKPGPDVVIVGYGLKGRNLARVLEVAGISFRVLDMNVDIVRRARTDGIPIAFGDGSRADALLYTGIKSAKIVVFVIPDPQAARRGVVMARRLAPTVYVIVRTQYLAERQGLLDLGADEVIPEEFETSIEIFSRVLHRLHVPRGNIATQVALIRREGYQLLREELTPQQESAAIRAALGETAVDTLSLPADSPCVGRALGELDLPTRARASVAAVVRKGEVSHGPGEQFQLEPDDVLLVVGSHAGIESCRAILRGQAFEDDG